MDIHQMFNQAMETISIASDMVKALRESQYDCDQLKAIQKFLDDAKVKKENTNGTYSGSI
jgi:hypothetical protein